MAERRAAVKTGRTSPSHSQPWVCGEPGGRAGSDAKSVASSMRAVTLRWVPLPGLAFLLAIVVCFKNFSRH